MDANFTLLTVPLHNFDFLFLIDLLRAEHFKLPCLELSIKQLMIRMQHFLYEVFKQLFDPLM